MLLYHYYLVCSFTQVAVIHHRKEGTTQIEQMFSNLVQEVLIKERGHTFLKIKGEHNPNYSVPLCNRSLLLTNEVIVDQRNITTGLLGLSL